MQEAVPQATLIPAPAKEDNNCACSECAFMKMNTLEKLYNCLQMEAPEILVAEDIQNKAPIPNKPNVGTFSSLIYENRPTYSWYWNCRTFNSC